MSRNLINNPQTDSSLRRFGMTAGTVVIPLIFLLFGCGGGGGTSRILAILTGVVTDATGSAVVGARVSVGARQTTLFASASMIACRCRRLRVHPDARRFHDREELLLAVAAGLAVLGGLA